MPRYCPGRVRQLLPLPFLTFSKAAAKKFQPSCFQLISWNFLAANSCGEGGAGKGEERSCLTLSGQYLGLLHAVLRTSRFPWLSHELTKTSSKICLLYKKRQVLRKSCDNKVYFLDWVMSSPRTSFSLFFYKFWIFIEKKSLISLKIQSR